MHYEVMQKKQQDDLGNYSLKVQAQLTSLLLRAKPNSSERIQNSIMLRVTVLPFISLSVFVNPESAFS